MLRVAVPNKGALRDDSLLLLSEAGYRCRQEGRELFVRDGVNGIEFVFLRPRDIGVYVGNGTLHMGVTGRDLALDSKMPFAELLALGFGKSSFRYAVPREGELTVEGFGGLRIATSYPNIVAADLSTRGIVASVVQLEGAVEIAVRLGVADAIADVVQSGRTLEQAGLRIVGDPVLESEAVLVARDESVADEPRAATLLERLRGILVARDYVMVEYDIERARLAEACEVTPGIESPTIAPLNRADWVAVKAMILQREMNAAMDRLKALGAKGIIITGIRTCRL